jgi:hypothetical protein
MPSQAEKSDIKLISDTAKENETFEQHFIEQHFIQKVHELQ